MMTITVLCLFVQSCNVKIDLNYLSCVGFVWYMPYINSIHYLIKSLWCPSLEYPHIVKPVSSIYGASYFSPRPVSAPEHTDTAPRGR